MESSQAEKQMSSTICKERIFHVRKVPYKPSPNQKFSKLKNPQFNEEPQEPKTLPTKKNELFGINLVSNAQKQLRKRHQNLKEEYQTQKISRLQVQECFILLQKLKQRQDELTNCNSEQQRLLREKQKLLSRRDSIKQKIQQLHQRNQFLRQQEQLRKEEMRIINMEYLRNMIMEMRFQNGIDIDPDQMTYEELLELQEKMGKVSKGLSQQQFEGLRKIKSSGKEDNCSICYSNQKQEEELILLHCNHYFHMDCLREWLSKEKICPLCKQEVINAQEKSLQSTQ